jgi:HK97 family phage portal protein
MSKKKSRRTSSSLALVEKANPNYTAVIQAGPSAIPVMMPRNMRAYLQEGYRNKTAFRVVGQIARSGAGIKWKHYYDRSKQREYSSSPLLDLWNRPNSEQGGSKFRENLLGYYCLTGNSYVLGINASQNPKAKFDELYCLRPDLTKVHISDQYEPDYYEFGPAYPYRRYDKPFVMHSKLFAGNDDVYGLSPIEVAAMLVDIQKASQKWNLSLMSNMAAPSGAWVTKQILNDPDYRNLKREIHDKFSGPRNAREPVILHGGVEWQSMSMTPMELDFLSSDEKTDRDIAGIFFNFPTFLLGLADATFANQSEAKHYLYTDIIFPIWDMFVDDLNSWLTPRYGGWLDYDREDVETIQERIQAAKAQASDRAMAEFAGGTTTFLEARAIQDKKPLPVKDFVMVKDVPVHVDDLDEYIAAMSGKTINPPPPPPQLMLPRPGSTTVTEEPQDDTEDENANQGNNEPNNSDTEDENADSTGKSLESPFVRSAFEVFTTDPACVPTITSITPMPQTKALDLSTTEQKEAYFNSMEALRGKWETEIQKRMADYFSDERKTVLAAIERGDDPDGVSGRTEHALSVVEQQGTLKHLIVKLYQDVASDVGGQVLQELKSQDGAPEHKDSVQDYLNLFGPDVLVYLLQLAATKVKQITETTRAEIQSALEEGVRAGEGVPKLAKRIDDLYLVQIVPNRSSLIASTEVVAASNYGSQQAARQSGLTLKKVWLSTSDSRTRPDHVAANGQEVGLDDPFVVGNSKLMFPGDNSLGAAADQLIRCRCTQYYVRVKNQLPRQTESDNTEKSSSRRSNREEYRKFMEGLLVSQVKEVTV